MAQPEELIDDTFRTLMEVQSRIAAWQLLVQL